MAGLLGISRSCVGKGAGDSPMKYEVVSYSNTTMVKYAYSEMKMEELFLLKVPISVASPWIGEIPIFSLYKCFKVYEI